MKNTLRIVFLSGLTLGLLVFSRTALSANSAHYVGFSYVSGIRDVWDWHEDNINLDDFEHGAPIGLSYRYAAISKPGFRFDVGLGPFVLIMGDVEYTDIPLQMSLGYSFFNSSNVRPYARFGASFHLNSGDYLEDENVAGVIGAIGIDFGRPGSTNFFVEAAYDSAEATFSSIKLNDNYDPIRTEEDIVVSGFMLTLGVRF
jgi:hypothetical protein